MSRQSVAIVSAALLVALLLPAASAQENGEIRGFHISGDLALNGAAPEGAVLHVANPEGTIDLRAAFMSGDTATPIGYMNLDRKYDENGPVEGYLHYFVEVPPGRYMIDIVTADNERMAMADVTTGEQGDDLAQKPWGTYYALPVPEMALTSHAEMRSVVVDGSSASSGSGAPGPGEPRGWHLFGDADLSGASAADVEMHVTSLDGRVRIHVTMAQPETTNQWGIAGMMERPPPGESTGGGWLHFWAEVPEGTYNVVIESGNHHAATTIETDSTDAAQFDHGTYYTQEVGLLVLREVQSAAPPSPAGGDAATPTPTPDEAGDTEGSGNGAQAPAPGVTPAASPSPAQGADATPAPAGTEDAEAGGENAPGFEAVGLVAALGFALVAMRRRG